MARCGKCNGQLSLFAEEERPWRERYVDECKEWLREEKGCEDPALFELFDELCERVGIELVRYTAEVFDLVTRDGFTIEELVDIIGIFSEPYSVCQNRAWSFRHGVPKEELGSLTHRRCPGFKAYGKDGKEIKAGERVRNAFEQFTVSFVEPRDGYALIHYEEGGADLASCVFHCETERKEDGKATA